LAALSADATDFNVEAKGVLTMGLNRFQRSAACFLLIAFALGFGVVGCQSASRRSEGQSASAAPGLYFRKVSLNDTEYRFAVYVPPAITQTVGKAPAAVFLNGSGECGTDGIRQLTQGMFPAMLGDPSRWPLVGIFPQKPTRESLWENHSAMVLACLGSAEDEFNLDRDRIALTGLSQGGHGTWMIAAKHPEVWSCLAPVCGPMKAEAIETAVAGINPATPVWAFHGLADDVVPSADTVAVVGGLRTRRSDGSATVLMTLYEGVNHNSWDKAYQTEGLGDWMAQRSRKDATTGKPLAR